MADCVRIHDRADERQTIFVVVGANDGIAIVESAELWSEPHPLGEPMNYFYYPLTFGSERFSTVEAADLAVQKRYPWTACCPDTD